MSETSSAIISLRDVGKNYQLFKTPWNRVLSKLGVYNLLPALAKRGMETHHALSNISFDIAPGERVGIIGRNGAGKTTLLKLIGGSISQTRGSIVVNGSVHSLLQAGIGFDPEVSGAENIRSSLAYNKLPPDVLDEAFEDIVTFCDLGEHLHQPFKTYSAGMASRLQFATATAIRPDILVIDEVLGAGDAYFLQKSAKRMQKLALSGCTLLLVSHATQQVLHFCTRALWIEDGKIVMDGPALDVTNAYEVYLERRTQAHRFGLPLPELGASTSDGAPGKMNQQDARAAMISTLADGREVYRWASNPGVKIHTLTLGDGHEARDVFRPGDDIVIDITLVAEESREFSCRYLLTFWTPEGIRAGRIGNNFDTFALEKGETHSVRFAIPRQPLTRGEYLLSFSVYDVSMERSTRSGVEIRYDLLAHALRLRIVSENPNSYLIDHPIEWTVAAQPGEARSDGPTIIEQLN